MLRKDELDQKAKDCAFEYDPVWWENRRHARKEHAKNGDIVAFYRNHHIYNGVVALWGRDRSAVIFYATPHDVADEKEHEWIAPVFRWEVNQQYVYNPVKSGKAFGEDDPEPVLIEVENEQEFVIPEDNVVINEPFIFQEAEPVAARERRLFQWVRGRNDF